MTHLAGTPYGGNWLSVDGKGDVVRFGAIHGITTDGVNVYVSEWPPNKIRKVVIATGEVTTLAGDGQKHLKDATGVNAGFMQPGGITHFGGSIYVTDYSGVRKIDPSNGAVTTLKNSPHAYEITHDGTDFYTFDSHFIKKFIPADSTLTDIAGGGGFGSADGTGTQVQFGPAACGGVVALGTTVYLADCGNHTIRKIERLE